MLRVLLVEDDRTIIRNLSELLAHEGYEVVAARTQDDAIAAAGTFSADVALVDITLAQGNGFAVTSALKKTSPSTGIIFLTASDDEFSTVAGLSMGADDYIAKPFRPRELIARMQAVLRRRQPAGQLLRLGSVTVDAVRGIAAKGGATLVLSAIEYRLLLLFASNPGRVVTREMMREALWEDAGAYVEDNTLSVYVKRLRDKIEDDPANPLLISTVRGVGYRTAG